MSTDAVLLDRALRAIRGLIEIGEHRDRPCPSGTPAPGGSQWVAVEPDGVRIFNAGDKRGA